MKVLLVDNASLIYRNNCFCCAEGTGKFATELAQAGVIVTMYGQKVSQNTNISLYDIGSHGINIAGLWRKKNKFINYLGLYLYALRYILQSDFVYIFYPNAFRYFAFICMCFGKRYGLYVRGDENIDDTISKYLYKKASVVLTVSQMFTDMVNNVTYSLVANTIRPMLSYDDRDVVYDRKYVKKEMYNILFLSRLQKEKGVLELLYALKQINDKGDIHFHLTVAGDGSYLQQSQIECNQLGMDNVVDFIGGIYDNQVKAELYKSSDLYVLPTYYNEGFPRTLYEAMIFGTPIITTFVGGISALMKNEVNCLRIEPRSVDSIADTLSYAMKHYEDMSLLARNSSAMVAQIVDRDRPTHAQQLFNIIKKYGK